MISLAINAIRVANQMTPAERQSSAGLVNEDWTGNIEVGACFVSPIQRSSRSLVLAILRVLSVLTQRWCRCRLWFHTRPCHLVPKSHHQRPFRSCPAYSC